jgi:hypothetical protein
MLELSVVIVAGLRLDALKLCLENLKVATAHPAEFVVVLCNATKELKAWVHAEAEAWKAEDDVPHSLVVYTPRGKPDVYECYNYGVDKAKGAAVCLTNDDMVFCEDWDEFTLDRVAEKTLVTGVVVEPGVVPVSPMNVAFDVGKTPAEFDAEKFRGVVAATRRAEVEEGKQGWYMPVLFRKVDFRAAGGYPTSPPFPHPNDVKFFTDWVKNGNAMLHSLDMIVYHFQRLSQRPKSRLWWGCEYRDDYVNLLDSPTSDLDFDGVMEDGFPTTYEYVYVDGDVLEEFEFDGIDDVFMRLYDAVGPGQVLDIEFDDLCTNINTFRGAPDDRRYGELLGTIFGNTDNPKRMGFTSGWLQAEVAAVGFDSAELHPGHLHQFKLTARKPY